jgi:hypothetical protein
VFVDVKRSSYSNNLDMVMDTINEIFAYAANSVNHMPDDNFWGSSFKLPRLIEREDVRKGIEMLFQLSRVHRKDIHDAFCNDKDFHKNFNNPGYSLKSFALLKSDEKIAKAFDAVCNSAYDCICTGATYENFEYHNKKVREDFSNINKQKVCPVCMTEQYFNNSGDLDHYFPRKKYPTLAVHPYNLIPTCKDCNGSANKGQKNPIDDNDIEGRIPNIFLTVFLPYLRPAHLEVDFDVDANNHRLNITMSPKDPKDLHAPKKIKNINRLYNLEKRWSDVLSTVRENVLAATLKQCGNHASDAQRVAQIRQLLQAYKISAIENTADFVKSIYASWLITEKNDKELLDFFSSSNWNVNL